MRPRRLALVVAVLVSVAAAASGSGCGGSATPHGFAGAGGTSTWTGLGGTGGTSSSSTGGTGTTSGSSTTGTGTTSSASTGGTGGCVVSDAGTSATWDGSVSATCPHTFSFADKGYSSVVLQADYLGWTTGVTMTKSASGTWQVTTPIPYGKDVEYKLVADGNWMPSPTDPQISLPSISQGTNVNNILQAVTCGVPSAGTLSLVGGTVTTTATGYSFRVQWSPGAAEIDPAKTVITLNGAAVAVADAPYDACSHTFSISVPSGITAPDKLGYLFQVTDYNGQTSRLFVPFWIEATPFTWQDAFIYEVMVDRFLASGTTSLAGANGPPTDPVGDWKGGDYGGVTQKITSGYFDAMGVNTLWLSSPDLGTKLCEMGVGANAGHCLSGYHSYFPISGGWTYGSENDPGYTSNGVTTPIDPHFGTLADLQTLVKTAHQHGIRVLVDLVVNHVFSDAAPPSNQSPQLAPLAVQHQAEQAWFNAPYNGGVNDCGSQNLWDTPESQTWNRADCWFDPYLPDFNTTSPTVGDAVANHAVWLMEQLDLDGFRIDAVKQVDHALCSSLRAKIDAAVATNLPVYMVGEALGGVQANVFDCVANDKLNGSMDDPLHNTIVGTILQSDGSSEGPAQDLYNGVVADEGAGWTGSAPGALMGHFFGSHDTPRAISLAVGDSNGNPWSGAPPAQETNPTAFARLRLAQTFLLTYDSIPVLWMGDEFGQPGTIDPDCRRMMRFGSALSSLEQATLTNLQTVGKIRAAHSALRRGQRTNLWVDGTFYADGRVDGADIAVVAINLGSSPATRTMNVGNIGLTGSVTDALSGTTISVAPGGVSADGGVYAEALTISLPALTAAVFTK